MIKCIKWLILPILFLVIIWYHFSYRVVVHYDNKYKPIEVYFTIMTDRGKTIARSNKKLASGSLFFRAKQSYGIIIYDLYYGALTWQDPKTKQKLGDMDILEDPTYPEGGYKGYCKLDIYLDKNAQFVRYEKTDFQFLNLCF